MRVVFLGAFDPEYPRVRVLREGLEALGVDARLIPASTRPFAREAGLVAGWASRAGGADAYVVPSFGHRDVPLVSLLARAAGVPLLFDPLVSRWDTQVGDLGRAAPRSATAARLRMSDALSMRLADVVLCDTWEHGELFATEFGVPRAKLVRVPVGADRAAFALGDARAAAVAGGASGASSGASRPGSPGSAYETAIRAVYVGGFLPLHGVETIVAAAALLEARRGPCFARFTLVGDGMTAHRADRDVASLGLRSIARVTRVSYPRALEALAEADLALGIFGATPKAGRVVPHKVYQALAIGVPVITRRSPAVAELFPESGRSNEPSLALVPAGNAEALAAAVESLALDPARRRAPGAAGRAAALRFATPEGVGAALVEAIERARAVRR